MSSIIKNDYNIFLQEGDKIPSADLFEDSPANKVNIADLCSGKKVIVFGVPGCFTPGCSKVIFELIFFCFSIIIYKIFFQTHLPGYVSKAADLKKEGINEIVCVSVNDPFVMSAWGKEHNAAGKVRMLADPSANFTKLLELDVDLPPLGGIRSKRYSMVIENGVVKTLNVEPDGTGLSCSLADKIKM